MPDIEKETKGKGKKKDTGDKKDPRRHQCEIILYPTDGNGCTTAHSIREEFEKRSSVKYYAIALHDQDADDKGNPLAAHFHAYANFGDTSWLFSSIAKWFNIPPERVQIIKSDREDKRPTHGRYRTIRYFTHMDQPEKHYYPASGFLANFDAEQFLAQQIAAEAARNKASQEAALVRTLIDKCAVGEIMPYDYQDKIPAAIYARYASQFKHAWEMYRARRLAKGEGNRDCTILWLHGEAGSGKTTMAKLFAKEAGLPSYIAHPGTDPMGGYSDQPIIILDELRPEQEFTYKSLLQFLDPHTVNAAKSRYYDKYAMADYIIVTSVYSPSDFYKAATPVSSDIDTAVQLYRRISQVWKVMPDTIFASHYDMAAKAFITDGKQKNPVPDYLAEIAASEVKRDSPLSVLAKISDKFDPAKRQLSIPGMGGA